MKRDQITRGDFPDSDDGYDRPSVDAHLAAVAAWAAALEAQVAALEVERDALRKGAARSAESAEETPAKSEGTQAEPPETEVVEAPGSDRPEDEPGTTSREDEVSARLVATRLALEGKGHDEIVSRLKDEYELDDLDSLVEQVLSRI